MKRFLLFSLLVIIIAAVVIVFCNMGHKEKGHSGTSCLNGASLCDDYPKADEKGQIVKHTGYVLQYSEPDEQPRWVMYLLTRNRLRDCHIKRKNNFKEDPEVNTGSALPMDYSKSGYDKGHLCPAADMEWSENTMEESFYMSNMSPQVPSFNRGIWKELEEKVRDWALNNDSLVIITGPVLQGNLQSIGRKNKVSVPLFYYKVIADVSIPDFKIIAFIMRNENSGESIFDFAVPADSVERLTGIDFFPDIPGVEELEKKVDLSLWK